jgi:hypothetical protein
MLVPVLHRGKVSCSPLMDMCPSSAQGYIFGSKLCDSLYVWGEVWEWVISTLSVSSGLAELHAQHLDGVTWQVLACFLLL